MSEATLRAAALAILDGGAAWTQKANARTASDIPCPVLNPNAVKYDVMGALIKAQNDAIIATTEIDLTSFHQVYEHLRSNIPGTYKNTDIESYNDDVTWAEVAALFA